MSEWIGAAATSRASSAPPDEVTTSTRPAKPASRSRCSTVSMYAVITGLSEASMQVEEARRYSRTHGLSWCESVTGTPGRCSARSSPTRSSCAGLTIDHSRQTATASTPRSRSVPSSATSAGSSSGFSTPPSGPIRSGTSKVSERGTYGSGYGC